MSYGRTHRSWQVPFFGEALGHEADSRVAESAYARLRQSSYPQLHGVACRFHDGVLTLSGRVPSYYLKQIAQSLVLSVEGILQVVNELEATEAPGRS